MKKILFRAGVLIGIFIVGVLVFSGIFNSREVADTRAMSSPTLPVLYMEVEGTAVNCLYGYRQEVDGTTLRETLTPLDTGRELAFQLNAYGNEILEIEYEVTSLTDGSLVENARVKNVTEEDGLYRASFQLSTPILLNQEYLLTLSVNTGEETVHYYTRLVQRSGVTVSDYLRFAEEFYQNCLAASLSAEQTAQLEPDSTADNSSFHFADIHSSSELLTWGSLSPSLVKKPVPYFTEINESTVSICQDYIISSQDSDGNTRYYTVKEFYRMRQGQNQVVLLNFERTTDQVFDGDLPILTSTGLNLGIVSEDVEYLANENAEIVAFVVNGELWSYNRSAGKITRVFGYRSGNWDEREENQNYAIKIAHVNETGDISFVVYGYMNSDRYEGQLGISVYTYSAEQNVAEEKIFIHSQSGFQAMHQSLSLLSYVNTENQLYVFMENTLYCINLADASYEAVKEGIDPDCFLVSESQKTAAWMDEMQISGSSGITVMNLDTAETTNVSAGAGEKIRALGFINEDLIYGLARDEDIVTDTAGNTVFAMYRVCIESFSGEIQKDYQQEGYYVTDIQVQDGLIELLRAQKTESGFEEVSSDHIMSNTPSGEESVIVGFSVYEPEKTQVVLKFTSSAGTGSLLVLRTQYLEVSALPELTMELPESGSENYYVYGKGRLLDIFTSLNEAIGLADEQVGTVLNEKQQYVWERGTWGSSAMLDENQLPDVILQGTLDADALGQALGENYTVLNLTGCSLESLYYQLSHGYPVVAQRAGAAAAVIIGYDIYDNIWIYDPGTQSVSALAFEDAQAQFEAGGNIFISYQENPVQ